MSEWREIRGGLPREAMRSYLAAALEHDDAAVRRDAWDELVLQRHNVRVLPFAIRIDATSLAFEPNRAEQNQASVPHEPSAPTGIPDAA